MLSRAERLLLQAEDFRAPVLLGRSCENTSTHRGFGGNGEVCAGGTAECGRHCKRPACVPSTLHSHPTQLLPPLAPSPALAAWSQSEPGQPEVPDSTPSEQPHPRPRWEYKQPRFWPLGRHSSDSCSTPTPPTELSVWVETACICAGQRGSHQPPVATELLNCG